MDIDWRAMFEPSMGVAEIILRGSIMYIALFLVLRFIARRQAGSFGPADLLVIVLIADASQNALGKDYTSLTEGMILVLTIVAWEYAIDWLAWRVPRLRPLLKAPALQLIADGKTLRDNLAHEMITDDELRAQLREKGVTRVEDVEASFLEGDGRLSVLKRSS
jgi:uncharacterized membrane protein YcaP (DUF421 family)